MERSLYLSLAFSETVYQLRGSVRGFRGGKGTGWLAGWEMVMAFTSSLLAKLIRYLTETEPE